MSTFRSQPFPAAGGAWRVVDGELVKDEAASVAAIERAVDALEDVMSMVDRIADGGPVLDSETQKPQAPARRSRQQKE